MVLSTVAMERGGLGADAAAWIPTESRPTLEGTLFAIWEDPKEESGTLSACAMPMLSEGMVGAMEPPLSMRRASLREVEPVCASR